MRWIAMGSDQGCTTAIDEMGRAWKLGVNAQGGPAWIRLPPPPPADPAEFPEMKRPEIPMTCTFCGGLWDEEDDEEGAHICYRIRWWWRYPLLRAALYPSVVTPKRRGT